MASGDEELVGGRYRVDAELGRGGSAIVHRAFDTILQRPVALKRMRGTSWDDRICRRFLEEARVLASLRHPNLLEVYDAGVDERGAPYVTARLLMGDTLECALADGPVTPTDALAWILPVLGALAVAHDRGIIHRDVKPSNVFLERMEDGRRAPVLLDFGIARRAEQPSGDTTPGTALGTPAYIAPEVISGDAPSAASDVWSTGVVLYRALTGCYPFEASGALATVAAVVRDSPRPLAEHAPGVPKSLAVAVDRALRPRTGRYPDARTFAHALLEAAVASGVDLPVVPDPHGLPLWNDWLAAARSGASTDRVPIEQAPRGIDRRRRVRRLALAAAAGVAIATGAGAVLFAGAAGGATEERPTVHARTQPSVGHGRVRDLAESRPAAEAPAPPVEQLMEQPPAPPAEPPGAERPPTRSRARSRSTTRSTATAPERAPQLPDIVTSWDL